jgi:hypothetical protein
MNATAARPARRYRCRCEHLFAASTCFKSSAAGATAASTSSTTRAGSAPRWRGSVPPASAGCPRPVARWRWRCGHEAPGSPAQPLAPWGGRRSRLRGGGLGGRAAAPDRPLRPARSQEVIPRLSHLSQVELAAVEAHERSHRDRPVVLNRLRWLRASEPLPGYDALDSDEIIRALADADAATVKAVRSYERHHGDRREVSLKPHASSRRHGQAPQRTAPAKRR